MGRGKARVTHVAIGVKTKREEKGHTNTHGHGATRSNEGGGREGGVRVLVLPYPSSGARGRGGSQKALLRNLTSRRRTSSAADTEQRDGGGGGGAGHGVCAAAGWDDAGVGFGAGRGWLGGRERSCASMLDGKERSGLKTIVLPILA